MSIDILVDKIIKKNSHLVVGLDPRFDLIPDEIVNKYKKEHEKEADIAKRSIIEFNKGIIDAVEDIVVAVKPQLAFYEKFGIKGLEAFVETINYAKNRNLHVIADAKRGDIEPVSKAYADAFISNKEYSFNADSVTVNPYMGEDSIRPFIENIKEYNRSIWVLVKTSNPSSKTLQDLESSDRCIYEFVASMLNNLSKETMGNCGYSNVNAVVGATHVEEIIRLRRILKNTYFLMPGMGAQGGKASNVVHGFNDDKLGALINSSRSILYNYQKTNEDYKTAARNKALETINSINYELKNR